MPNPLPVCPVGFLGTLKDDPRSPESFALPACLTSLMEYLGEDVRAQTIDAHNREWEKRKLNDAILAATGMAFGLLWHSENCRSCLDLTQVDEPNVVRRAFDYVGYDCEVIDRTDDNLGEMKSRIVGSIDAGKPVLAFGVVGPPECAIVCGYERGGDTLLGWCHFQSHKPEDCAPNGMFRKADWHKELWKIVLCGEKKEPVTDLQEIVRHGVGISAANEIGGLYAGAAAYDAWVNYVANPANRKLRGKELRDTFWLHHTVVGNHAEARCYLGDFLRDQVGENAQLRKAAALYAEIHDTCWKIWAVSGGLSSKNGYKAFRKKKKQAAIAALIREIEALDFQAVAALNTWLDENKAQ